jgi:hypothetical protein
MPENLSIQIRIGQEHNDMFAGRLQTLVKTGTLPDKVEVNVKKPKPPIGGFALNLPPEIIVAIGTAIATATASEIVKTIWSELRDFLKSRHTPADKDTKPVVIIINGNEFKYGPDEMPDAPPLQPS